MLTLATQLAFAQESFYIINQKPEQSTLTLDYILGNSSFAGGQSEVQSLGFEYRYSLSRESSLWMASRLGDRNSRQEGLSSDGMSLSDVELGFKSGHVYDLFTSVFGLNASVSPGAAQDPRLGRTESTNQFSGTHSLAPYVGFEAYSERLAVGAQLEVRLYSDILARDGTGLNRVQNENPIVPRFSAFVEIPLVQHLDLGFQVAVARPDFALDQYILGGSGTQYELGAYGQWRFDAKTTGLVRALLKNQKYPLSDERFDVGVGLRRQL